MAPFKSQQLQFDPTTPMVQVQMKIVLDINCYKCDSVSIIAMSVSYQGYIVIPVMQIDVVKMRSN